MQSHDPQLAEVIHSARIAKGLTTRELADAVGINQSTLVRTEAGAVSAPSPRILSALARSLDLSVADLYSLAGYTEPSDLPAFTPYLRSKFAGLPAEARAELEQSFRHIADKYGFDAEGPRPGEDEH